MRTVMTMLAGFALALGLFLVGSASPASNGVGSCSKPVFLSEEATYTFCGPQVFSGTTTVWVRDRQNGNISAVPGARWRSNPPYGP